MFRNIDPYSAALKHIINFAKRSILNVYLVYAMYCSQTHYGDSMDTYRILAYLELCLFKYI